MYVYNVHKIDCQFYAYFYLRDVILNFVQFLKVFNQDFSSQSP